MYVCLINDDTGSKLIPGLELQPGTSTPTFHSKHFTITLGNSSVTMFVDGTPKDRAAVERSDWVFGDEGWAAAVESWRIAYLHMILGRVRMFFANDKRCAGSSAKNVLPLLGRVEGWAHMSRAPRAGIVVTGLRCEMGLGKDT